MPVPPTVSTPLRKLMEMVDREELILPEIQREFVWQRRSVKLLFDSLFRQLPIGQMLVWKARKTVRSKPFYGRKPPSGAAIDSFYGYLLDGQQRITALTRVRDADEKYPLMFYAFPDRESEQDEPFVWRRKWHAASPWYVPVRDLLTGDVLKYLREIKDDKDYKPEFEGRIHDELLKVKQLLDYQVGVIEFETEDYRDATELFIRFNSTGTKLKKSDLFLAELAVEVPGLVVSDIQRTAQKYVNFDFTMPFLTQCLLAVCTRRLRTKASSAWKDFKNSQIKDAWRRTERALGHVIRLLTGTVRWQSGSLIPSFNALIPLLFVAAENDGFDASDASLARRWLLLTGIHGHFSGAVHTEIDKLLRRLTANASVQELCRATRSSSLRKLRPNDFVASRISGPLMSLYVSMLAENDARDWCDRYARLDGTVSGHNAQLQVHHFFPRSLLKKHGVGEDDINTVGNYTLLSAGTNLHVGAEEPATYMKRIQVSEAQLTKQCIPLNRDLWHLGRYYDFLEERRKLLATTANDLLDSK
jgi:hypothetical protein